MSAEPSSPVQVRITAPGGPEVLVLEAATQPVPASGDVLIRVRAAGVNRHDCGQRARGPSRVHSDVPGLEVAGEVAAVGEGVTRFRVGDRVCALTDGGGYATWALARAEQTLPIPAGVSDTEAAGLPEAAFTIGFNLFELGRLAAGESVLLHGGTSGVGSLAIQILAALGHPVFVTCGSADKCAIARQLGAREAIDYHDATMVDQVLAATAGRGVDLILDMSGGQHTRANIAMMARRARLMHLSPGGGRSIEVPLRELMAREGLIGGSLLRPQSDTVKAGVAAWVESTVWPLVPAAVRPVVHATLPLAESGRAHALLESGEVVGKVILVLQ